MTMYIYVFEDGSVGKSKEFADEDKESVDAGILEVIDISNPDNPVTYYNNKWHDLPGA